MLNTIKSLLMFFVFLFAVDIETKSIASINSQYDESLTILKSIKCRQDTRDHKELVTFFSFFSKEYKKLIKELTDDIVFIKKSLRTNTSDFLKSLYVDLRDMRNFLKKNKINYDAYFFHAYLEREYRDVLNKIDANKDIVVDIHEEYNQEEIRKSLSMFLKKVIKDFNQASTFEDILHADVVDLKLNNYVYKIELIRIRNTILFDNRYKYRK